MRGCERRRHEDDREPVTAVLGADERAALHARTLRTLVGSQVLGGLGLAAGITSGRARSLVVLGAALPSTALLLVGLLVYGAGTATSLQARYAGADLAPPAGRGRALSTVLVATSLGAVAGPNLVGPTGALAASAGLPRLSGPFVLASLAYAAAAAVLAVRLRPDPLLTARQHEASAPAGAPGAAVLDRAALRLGATVMVVTQLVMVAVMTMTPVHMREHGSGLGATGLVIGLHVAAMFLPSPVTGRLADRHGPRPVAVAGGASLAAAGLLAAVAPADSVALLALALVLLGLGWNLGLLAGTTLLTAAVPLGQRAGVQGRVDVAVALAGATGGLGSGFVVAAAGFAELSLAGGGLALVVLLAALRPAPYVSERA